MVEDRINKLLGLLDNDGHNSFLLYALANEYHTSGHLTLANEYYLKLKYVDPSYIGLYYHLGRLYEDLGEAEKALETYSDGIFMCQKIGDNHAMSELKGAKSKLELLF